jgi:predicted transcriptional regulator of viral defense system
VGGKADTDRLVARLAADQHGVVTRPQLLQAGLTSREIEGRMAAARLLPIHRGVYAVGHRRLTREGWWMAAVLACGEGAVLSHATAAAVWDLQRNEGAIHVTVPGSRKAPRGIKLHRSATLTAAEIAEYRGIPVTKVARTIVDLSRTVTEDELARIVEEADRRQLVDFRHLKSARSTSLRAVLKSYDPAPTRSSPTSSGATRD